MPARGHSMMARGDEDERVRWAPEFSIWCSHQYSSDSNEDTVPVYIFISSLNADAAETHRTYFLFFLINSLFLIRLFIWRQKGSGSERWGCVQTSYVSDTTGRTISPPAFPHSVPRHTGPNMGGEEKCINIQIAFIKLCHTASGLVVKDLCSNPAAFLPFAGS